MGPLVFGEQRPASCPTTGGGTCIFPYIYSMYPAASLWPLTLPPPGGVTWNTCYSSGHCPTVLTSDGTGAVWGDCDTDKCPLAGRRGWAWRGKQVVHLDGIQYQTRGCPAFVRPSVCHAQGTPPVF